MIQEHISFHAKAGIRVIYTFTNDDGSPRDMTGVPVELAVSNGFTKPLAVLDGEPSKVELVLRGADLPLLVGKKAEYIVLDKSTDPFAEVASGNLMVTGWLL